MTAHWKYLKYLVRHKWFVFVAGRKTKAPLWRLVIHDWSKFLPCEWMPYARYFYGTYPQWNDVKRTLPTYSWRNTKEGVAESFDRAWLHHQHRNPHHWQHWILREDSGATKVLEMPDKFVREMVADWMGAGRAITGRWEVKSWWEKNKGRIRLGELTRKRVEDLIERHGEGTPS